MRAVGIITFVVLVTVVIYACAVMARRADDWEEEYWRNKK